ncbi:MAG: hypothetical protein ABIG95_02520 [Candidatus Woesearchaeota archaeon]
MALLGAFIDERTLVALATDANTTFAHGLPASPDWIGIRETASSASGISHINVVPIWDATNVTLYNSGQRDTEALEAQSIVYHSVIR